MSARREKRLRKMEAKVTYMDGRVRDLERRLLVMEEIAAHPVVIRSTETEKPRPRGVLASLLLKLRGGRKEDVGSSLEHIKSHPPKTFH